MNFSLFCSAPLSYDPCIFTGNGESCIIAGKTTTTTSSTTTTTSSSSSTTTTTTTLFSQIIQVINNSTYDNIYYRLSNEDEDYIFSGFVNSGDDNAKEYSSIIPLTLLLDQFYAETIYIQVKIEITGLADVIHNYNTGFSSVAYTGLAAPKTLIKVTITNTTPVTTTTTTSSTTTSTTTCVSRTLTLLNNLITNNIQFTLKNGSGTTIYQDIINSGQTKTPSFPCCDGELSVTFTQLDGFNINTTAVVTQGATNAYSYNAITFTLGQDKLDCGNLTIVLNTGTTTTTSTTSSTTTSTTTGAGTTTTTTSTSTTSTSTTTTSSTTTTTTTIFSDPLIIRIVHTGGTASALGFNTQAWNVKDNTLPAPPTITQYYTLTGGTLFPTQTQTTYTGPFFQGNKIKFRYENTGVNATAVSLYFSNNNGVSYTYITAFDLLAYSGSGPYPFNESTYTVSPNNIGNVDIFEARIHQF